MSLYSCLIEWIYYQRFSSLGNFEMDSFFIAILQYDLIDNDDL